MTTALWVTGALGTAAALGPEIIKGVKVVVSSLRRGRGRHPSALAPSPVLRPSAHAD